MILINRQVSKEPDAKPSFRQLVQDFGTHPGSATQARFLTNPSILLFKKEKRISVGMRPELSKEPGKLPPDSGTWRDVSAKFKGDLTLRTEGFLPEEFERQGKKVIYLKTAEFFDTLRDEGTLADPLLVFRNSKMYLTHKDSTWVYCVDFTGRAEIKDEDAGKIYSAFSTAK